jgi:hypothetical protein
MRETEARLAGHGVDCVECLTGFESLGTSDRLASDRLASDRVVGRCVDIVSCW